MSLYNSNTEIPKNIDMLINLIEGLIRPLPAQTLIKELPRIQRFSPTTPDGKLVNLYYFPRILDPNMTNYFIQNLHRQKKGITFSYEFMVQALELVYNYAYAKSIANFQLIGMHPYVRRVINGSFVHEIKFYDYKNETSDWHLSSPKYHVYNFHVSLVTYDVEQKTKEQHRGAENTHKLMCKTQKRAYLRHLELVGDEPTEFTKKFTLLQRLNYAVDTDDEGELPKPKPRPTYVPVQCMQLSSGAVTFNSGHNMAQPMDIN